MEKRREPFELVSHIDEDGTRATACYRTRVFKDDGTVDTTFPPIIEGVTLAKLGANFPWKEFADAALQGALLTIERNAVIAALKEEEKTAELAAKDAELAVKTAENAAKDLELAAEREITVAAMSLAAKTADYITEQDANGVRSIGGQEAAQAVAEVEAKDAELTAIKMPEEEKRRAAMQAEIERLQAELDPDASKGAG